MKLPVFFTVFFYSFPPFSAQVYDPLKSDQNVGIQLYKPTAHSFNIQPPAHQCAEAVGLMRQKAALITGGEPVSSGVYSADPEHMANHHLTVQQLLCRNRSSDLSWVCEGGSTCGMVRMCDGHTTIRRDQTTRYDLQNIVALQDDPVVLQAASSLFEKHPVVSTMLLLQKGSMVLLKGSGARLTACSRVVLVGHGWRGDDGDTRLGGYRPEELARLVRTMKMETGRVRTLSLVGCEVAGDLRFAQRLLKELVDLGVETTLHLRTSPLSVGPHGEKLTRDGRDGEGVVWRHKDGSVKVIAQLDHSGNLQTRMEESERGRIIPDYQGHVLLERPWPTKPERFIPSEKHNDETLKTLEALTWAIFFKGDETPILPTTDIENLCWIKKYQNKITNNDRILIIESIRDVVREIRYHAKQDKAHTFFYKLNDYIYSVDASSIYVHLVGKYKQDTEKGDITCNNIDKYTAESYNDILAGNSNPLDAQGFHWFCQQTFESKKCNANCGRWGHYFMAAVFAESVRNFRQFGIFLLSFAACSISRDNELCSQFLTNNPMARGGTWIETKSRGFYGWSSEKAKDVLNHEKVISSSAGKVLVKEYKSKWIERLNDILGWPCVIRKDLFEAYRESMEKKQNERKTSMASNKV